MYEKKLQELQIIKEKIYDTSYLAKNAKRKLQNKAIEKVMITLNLHGSTKVEIKKKINHFCGAIDYVIGANIINYIALTEWDNQNK